MVIVQQLLKNVEIIGWCLVWLRNRKGAVSSLCVNVGGQSHMSLGEKIRYARWMTLPLKNVYSLKSTGSVHRSSVAEPGHFGQGRFEGPAPAFMKKKKF